MSKSDINNQPFILSCARVIIGALVFAGLVFAERLLAGLPATYGQLWLPLLLGGVAGALFDRARQCPTGKNHRLEDSEAHFRHLYQNTPAMLHTTDSRGRLVDVSQAWLDTLGYSREEVVGKNFFDFMSGENLEDLRSEHFRKLHNAGAIRSVNYLMKRNNGETLEVALSEVAQKDATGTITGSLAVLNDLTNHRATEERIERLAYYDTLTGLPNRTLMNDRILQSMAQARRDNRQVGIFFFDLDRFKLINDTQGHAVGDLVLRSVAQRLKKFIREGDTFARLGGDEFVIIQGDPNHDPNFSIMGRRILETLNQPFTIGSREFFTTASIGVAIYPADGEDPQTLLKSADTAMYVAKSRGRNNIQFFSSEMNAAALAKTDLESRLRKALTSGGLQLYYQPQVNLATEEITGVEALLRWYDGNGRLIPPMEIVSVAEECGLIYPLGEWVMRTACYQAKAWRDAGLPQVRISVNLSGHHIREANFIDTVEKILSETGIKANQLEIELAENSIMGHVSESIMVLTDLKIRGINLAIDDFGTGYSSLLYLRHFPIQRIKIAQEFIRDIIHNPDYAAITEAILVMAASLHLSVTAVGVEDRAQLEFLRKRGCREVQGKLFGTPMTAGEIANLLKEADAHKHEKNPGKGSDLLSSRNVH